MKTKKYLCLDARTQKVAVYQTEWVYFADAQQKAFQNYTFLKLLLGLYVLQKLHHTALVSAQERGMMCSCRGYWFHHLKGDKQKLQTIRHQIWKYLEFSSTRYEYNYTWIGYVKVKNDNFLDSALTVLIQFVANYMYMLTNMSAF